jgi:hypothetical protein
VLLIQPWPEEVEDLVVDGAHVLATPVQARVEVTGRVVEVDGRRAIGAEVARVRVHDPEIGVVRRVDLEQGLDVDVELARVRQQGGDLGDGHRPVRRRS